MQSFNHLKFQEKITFTHALSVNSAKLKKNGIRTLCGARKIKQITRGAPKIKKKERHFEKGIYRVPHERSNITASFVQDLKFKKKKTFTYALWVNSDKSK